MSYLPALALNERPAMHAGSGLSLDSIRQSAPAVFASQPHERTSRNYTFISTQRLLEGLGQAGFLPVAVRQTRSKAGGSSHACHVIRLRRRFEPLEVGDAFPEVVIVNSHDGTGAYHLRLGLYRLVCSNGLILDFGDNSVIRVPHRGNVLDEVIVGALRMCERFGEVADQVGRMERRLLTDAEQIHMAEKALFLRHDDATDARMQPSQLLIVRRPQDVGNDLWRVTNRLQESLLQGGLIRRAPSGRLTRTRRITAIKKDVQLNTGLWGIAMEMLAA